ncbi:MAG TPA: DUF58 domain-containing protein [Acidimicrobiales bacterium]|nr:DUF58 domain-containing protein [Acidimicrobiales bacterium]
MTRLGYWSVPFGAGLVVLGLLAHWQPVAVLGAGALVLTMGSLLFVLRRPRLRLERAVEPPRVEKGQPAIAVIHVTNLSRRSLAPLTIEQRLGDRPVRARLPRLRPGERGLRTYRLPTADRGVYDVGPVELPRADPFGLCRTVQKMGEPQKIAVHPRLLRLQPLPTGMSRNLEGPSSDSSPQGSVTFHRLREYVVGDDLRTVHWPSTARAGQLVVRHNVDTAQPYTVVLFDLDPARYSPESFEEAVDVAASTAVSMAAGKAPVQLRTTSGDRLGGPSYREPSTIVDFLTDVAPDPAGSLEAELVLLRRDRGGTALVVVTGPVDTGNLPTIAGLRRRFDRVIVLSLVSRTGQSPTHPGIVVVEASTVAEMALRWNTVVAR